MPVDVILDTDATRTGRIAGWVGRREPNILPAEVIIIVCERDGMHWPVERFPQVSAKWFWLNRWRRVQLEWFHVCSARRVDSKEEVAATRDAVAIARKINVVEL